MSNKIELKQINGGTPNKVLTTDGSGNIVATFDFPLQGQISAGAATGTNTYVFTASPAVLAYTLDRLYLLSFQNNNTGAVTLNVNGLGAVSVKKVDGTGALVALTTGDLKVGALYKLVYDGTQFQVSIDASTLLVGTVNRISKFTPDGSHLGNSLLLDNGVDVLIDNGAKLKNATSTYSLDLTGGILSYTSFFAFSETGTERARFQNKYFAVGLTIPTAMIHAQGEDHLSTHWGLKVDTTSLGQTAFTFNPSFTPVAGSFNIQITFSQAIVSATSLNAPAVNIFVLTIPSFSTLNQILAAIKNTYNALPNLITPPTVIAGSNVIFSAGPTWPTFGNGTSVSIAFSPSTPPSLLIGPTSISFAGGGTLNSALQSRNDRLIKVDGFFQYVDGSQGLDKVLISDTNGVATWSSLAYLGLGPSWFLTGNAITSGQFLGTTNAQALVIKVNNIKAGLIDLSSNTYYGYNSVPTSLAGSNNTSYGGLTMQSLTSGSNNVAIGLVALGVLTTGSSNVAVGYLSLGSLISSSLNTGVGFRALRQTTGSNNVGLGPDTGDANITGTNNTFLGYAANASTSGLTNATAIGANSIVGTSNSLVLGGIGANAVNVGIGITSPLSPLHVLGTTNDGSTNMAYFTSANGVFTASLTTDGELLLGRPGYVQQGRGVGVYNATGSLNAILNLETQFAARLLISANGGSVASPFLQNNNAIEAVLGNLVIYTSTNNGSPGNIIFGDNYSGTNFKESVRFQADGKVGIGNVFPSVLLHIGSGASIGGLETVAITKAQNGLTLLAVTNQDGGNAASADMLLTSDTAQLQISTFSTGYLSSGVNQAATSVIASSTSNLIVGTQGADQLSLWTNSLERITILSSGLVGIGTITPGYLVDISDNNNTTADSATLIIRNVGTGLNYLQTAVIFNAALSGNADSRAGRIYGAYDGGGILDARLTFQSTSNTGYSDVLTLKAGRVGIGNITPAISAALDITSTTHGFLPPRMTTVQRNAIGSKAVGLVVFDTDLDIPIYYADNSGSPRWQKFSNDGAA